MPKGKYESKLTIVMIVIAVVAIFMNVYTILDEGPQPTGYATFAPRITGWVTAISGTMAIGGFVVLLVLGIVYTRIKGHAKTTKTPVRIRKPRKTSRKPSYKSRFR